MHEASFPSRPTHTVRFEGPGRSGTVRVYYGVTRHPRRSGFDVLAGFPWAGAGVGFPTIKAEVRSERPGYGSSLAWIQWVAQEYGGRRRRVELVDRFPSLLDRDLPFAAMGYAPTFFDAPAYNSRPRVDWRAALFLCTLPIMSRRESIVPLVGFLWGYRIARRGGKAEPYPCTRATRANWEAVRPRLAERHPSWKFGPEADALSAAPPAT